MRPASLLKYAVAAAIAALLAGRFLSLPLSLTVVGGRSMEPTLFAGDLVVGVRGRFGVGDVVIAFENPAYSVVHRVVRVDGGFVTTKGDANPLPDPPMPEEYVRYRVLAVIPRYLWLPAVLAPLLAYAVARRRSVRWRLHGPYQPLSVTLTAVAAFVSLNAAVVVLVPAHYASYRSALLPPRADLSEVRLLDDGSALLLTYSAQNVVFTDAGACTFSVGNRTFRGEIAWVEGGDSLWIVCVNVPRAVYECAYERGARHLDIEVNLKLDKGELSGKYNFPLSWKRLELSPGVMEAVVHNPNYVEFEFEAKVTYMDVAPPFHTPTIVAIEDLGTLTVAHCGTRTIALKSLGKYAYVEIRYTFMGEEVLERRRVEIAGA